MHLPVPAADDSASQLPELPFEEEADEQGQEEVPEVPEDPEQAQRAAEAAGEGAVADYAGRPATAEERDRMWTDPVLRSTLRGYVCKRVPRRDADDVVMEALAAAHRAPKLPGGDGPDRDRYAMGVTRYKVLDYHRLKGQQREIARAVKVAHAAGAMPGDAVAARDLLAKVLAVPDDKLDDLDCVIRNRRDKEKLTKLAAERNENPDTFAKRIRRFEAKLRANAGKMGGAFVLLLAVGVGWGVFGRVPRMARDQPGAVEFDQAVSTHVGQTDPKDWARVLRGAAFRACMDNQWKECLDGLATASELDPDGNRDPAVIAAKIDAENGITNKGDWHPAVVRAYAPYATR